MSFILALVYVTCYRCGLNQPLQNTRPRNISQSGCAKWLHEHGWTGNYGTYWQCPECVEAERAKKASA